MLNFIGEVVAPVGEVIWIVGGEGRTLEGVRLGLGLFDAFAAEAMIARGGCDSLSTLYVSFCNAGIGGGGDFGGEGGGGDPSGGGIGSWAS